MVTIENIGATVKIQATDDYYQFVDGWVGILDCFDSGYGVVHVMDETVESGYKEFLVPPDQLVLQ